MHKADITEVVSVEKAGGGAMKQVKLIPFVNKAPADRKVAYIAHCDNYSHVLEMVSKGEKAFEVPENCIGQNVRFSDLCAERDFLIEKGWIFKLNVYPDRAYNRRVVAFKRVEHEDTSENA